MTFNENTQDFDLDKSFDIIFNSKLSRLFVSQFAKIESYDSAKQLASVKPLHVSVTLDEENNEVKNELPVINDVPVYFPQSSSFYISVPVQPGDLCLLVFNDRSLDKILESDGSRPLDPGDNRKHSLNDAFAFVGFGTKRKVIDNVPTDAISLAKKDGSAEFRITNSNELTFKGSAARFGDHTANQALALAQQTNQRFQAIENHINNNISGHTHIGNLGAPTGPATGNILPGVNVDSTKVFSNG